MTVWRAAVYAAPGSGTGTTTVDPHAARLRELAEEWLGRSVDGREVGRRAPAGWTRDEVDAITVTARSYGFHATLKPPFRLAPGRSLDDLVSAVDQLAARVPSVWIPRLRLDLLGSFFALLPGTEPDADTPLRAVADAVVTDLDAFRAPLTDEDRARRNPDALTARQRELLERWGYPHVLDEFRFHLTLTDRIPAERLADVGTALRSWFDDVLGRDIPLDVLAVFTQSAPDAPFRLHSVHPMSVRRTRRTAPELLSPDPGSPHPLESSPPTLAGADPMEGITR